MRGTTLGTRSADLDVVSAGGDHPVEAHSRVSGSASAPALLSSSAAAMRGHLVEIDPATPAFSPPTVAVESLFEVFWDFDLSVVMPFLELADAGAHLAIAGFEAGETLTPLRA